MLNQAPSAPPNQEASAPPNQEASAPPNQEASAPPNQEASAPPNQEASAPPPANGTPEPNPNLPPPPTTNPTTPDIGKAGTVLWKFETGGSVLSSPAVGPDGTVYIRSTDKNLYAIKTDSKGLAKSPWPMRGQNAQHTGRAIGSGSSEPTELTPTNPEPI